jgi:hypothetical protein
METLLSLIIGGIAGFIVHSISMKVSFKQRTIENKIKTYDSIICSWVKFRNYVYSASSWQDYPLKDLDQIYGQSQQLIAEVFLVCDDYSLAEDLNSLNEGLYRFKWQDSSLEEMNEKIEEFKIEALKLINRMREDIKSSTRLDISDFIHIFSGLRRNLPNPKMKADD